MKVRDSTASFKVIWTNWFEWAVAFGTADSEFFLMKDYINSACCSSGLTSAQFYVTNSVFTASKFTLMPLLVVSCGPICNNSNNQETSSIENGTLARKEHYIQYSQSGYRFFKKK